MSLFVLCGVAGGVLSRADDHPGSLVIKTEVQNVFGEPLDVVAMDEPAWMAVSVINDGITPVTLFVPSTPSINARIESSRSDPGIKSIKPRYFTEYPVRRRELKAGETLAFSLFVGESTRFVREGSYDLKMTFEIMQDRLNGSKVQTNASVNVGAPMGAVGLKGLLTRMLEEYSVAPGGHRHRLLLSLEVFPSVGDGWLSIAAAGLRDELESLQLETVNLLRRTDLDRAGVQQLLSYAAEHCKGLARPTAEGLLRQLALSSGSGQPPSPASPPQP